MTEIVKLIDLLVNYIMLKDKLNILNKPLKSCCNDPMSGYWRDGYCRTAQEDQGTHVVCAVMTQEF